jgi:hypothetical protein
MEILVVFLITAIAVTAVVLPLVRGRGTTRDPELDAPEGTTRTVRQAGEVEREIQRYRVSLSAGTVCRRCGRANPEGSRFCSECGRRLPAARRLRLSVKAAP